MANVTIYSTATCGYCKMLKNYLMQHAVEFDEKRADADQTIAQELYERSGQLGVPFTVIRQDDGSEVAVLGFDKPMIDEVLGLRS